MYFKRILQVAAAASLLLCTHGFAKETTLICATNTLTKADPVAIMAVRPYASKITSCPPPHPLFGSYTRVLTGETRRISVESAPPVYVCTAYNLAVGWISLDAPFVMKSGDTISLRAERVNKQFQVSFKVSAGSCK